MLEAHNNALRRGKGRRAMYKVGIKTSGDHDWVYNAMRFKTYTKGVAYAEQLVMRWSAVKAFIVVVADTPEATKK
jgi:hypothetical protein